MNIGEHLKGLILAVIVIALFVYGYRYYRYTQNDPEFCETCHMVKEAYADWSKGKHRDVICQNCHQMGNLEQNVRLVSYIMTGKNPVSLTHGRMKPWQECSNCHMDDISQGSVSPTKSYGHAKHAVTKKIECKTCHSPHMHDFPANESPCDKCHPGKGVHGISMDKFSCLKCHSFSRKPLPMLSKNACVKCHVNFPKKGPMSGLSCHYCHKPHKQEKPTSATCTVECHKTEATIGQHGLHAKAGIECMHCHKRHSWTVSEAMKKALCSECHSYRDSRSFRYIF